MSKLEKKESFSEQKCEFNSDCRDLRSQCVDGYCVRNECENVDPEIIDTLTNDDLNCMNFIASGKYQGCYTCPNARSVGGKCTCTDCVNDTIKIIEGDEQKPIDRCCSKIENDLCVDDVPNPLPDEANVSAVLSQLKSKKGVSFENFAEFHEQDYPDNVFSRSKTEKETIKKVRKEAYEEDRGMKLSFVFMIIVIIVVIAAVVIALS